MPMQRFSSTPRPSACSRSAACRPSATWGSLPKLSFVFDLIYNPAVTELMLRARARGIPVVNGLRMLVVQAEAAARDFLSIASPSTARRPNRQRALKKFMRTSSGSSKTSCFQACRGAANPPSAAFLRHGLDAPSSIWMKKSRPLRNSPIPEIFRRHGEPAFRDLESRIAAIAGARRGVVIATGGGTMMRVKNVSAFKAERPRSALKRPIEELPTMGRPSRSRGRSPSFGRKDELPTRAPQTVRSTMLNPKPRRA